MSVEDTGGMIGPFHRLAPRRVGGLAITLWMLCAGLFPVQADTTFKLHPANPHYFLWRDRPTVLITSAEHYGAVLNLDFDYRKYLDTLAREGMNHTRTFTGGAYVEPQGAFNIERNTLAPLKGRFIAPWARSERKGYAGGGNRFDLTQWNADYFARLRDFVAYAGNRGVVVEINLFCPFYEDLQWRLSPFSTNNNVNGLGDVSRLDVYTLDKHGGLLEPQERLTRKIVDELRSFDNVFYEVCNEPYFGGVTLAWQHRIAEVIQDAQRDHAQKKLVSRNVANQSAAITDPHPAFSLFNFHYATPPDAVALNYHLGKPIGDNETGFRGTADAPYRMEAWDFMVAGGALFNHLDYSFAVGYEDGTFEYPSTQPGGGGPGLRRQLRQLKEFIEGFDFLSMHPSNQVLRGALPAGSTARALVQEGEAYAIYLRQQRATGPFSVRWTGYVIPRYSEFYTFHTFSNDGVRLWVRETRLIDDWTEHGEKENQGTIALQAGERYAIRLEYFYNGGEGAAKLWWSSESQELGPVPSSQLQTKIDGNAGLRGEYFQGRNFDRAWFTREDKQVHFAWGTGSPAADVQEPNAFRFGVTLPAGEYDLEWMDPISGEIKKREIRRHTMAGDCQVEAPPFDEDMALRIMRRQKGQP